MYVHHRFERQSAMSHANIMLVKFAIAIVIMGHWMACTWCMMAQLETGHTWLTSLTGNDWDEMQMGHFDIYSAALYWAVVTITRSPHFILLFSLTDLMPHISFALNQCWIWRYQCH